MSKGSSSLGNLELVAKECQILNPSEVLPFTIAGDAEANENTRLQYRYLDLRRKPLQNRLILRAKISSFIRRYLDSKGFLDIETPFLNKTTQRVPGSFLYQVACILGSFIVCLRVPRFLNSCSWSLVLTSIIKSCGVSAMRILDQIANLSLPN